MLVAAQSTQLRAGFRICGATTAAMHGTGTAPTPSLAPQSTGMLLVIQCPQILSVGPGKSSRLSPGWCFPHSLGLPGALLCLQQDQGSLGGCGFPPPLQPHCWARAASQGTIPSAPCGQELEREGLGGFSIVPARWRQLGLFGERSCTRALICMQADKGDGGSRPHIPGDHTHRRGAQRSLLCFLGLRTQPHGALCQSILHMAQHSWISLPCSAGFS